MKIVFINLAILLVSFCNLVSGQTRTDSFFKNGQVVNFIGNSITHGTVGTGRFHNYIMLYYATRFPDQKISFHNSGIWGDNANSFLRRMDYDILRYPANFSIVMAGMNDVNRSLYDPAKQSEPDIETRKARALSDYKGYLENVILRLRAVGTTVILQKPSIYDETGNLAAANLPGVNDALQKCTVIIDELALKYNLKTVDYWTILNTINQQIQIDNPSATIISSDRIHPASPGNLVMAYQFLKSTSAPKYIANVEIQGSETIKSDFCTISDLSNLNNKLSFKYKPESLPFPVADDAELALSLVPFQDELNTEMLKVTSLPAGRYALTINGSAIANFTAEDLAQGINLALLKNTPQYKQALIVKAKCDEYRDLQVKLRDMKLIEINYLAKELWTDFNAAKSYIENLKNTGSVIYTSQKSRFDAYLINKPQEGALENNLVDIATSIYTLNKPAEYEVTIAPTTQTHSWDFNDAVISNKTEGWTIVNYTNPATAAGVLNLTAAQTYCHIKYDVPFGSIDPSLSNNVEIRLRNTTENTKARFYWWGSSASAAFIEFDISANDTDFKEYTINLGKDSRWSGNISLIRFDVPSPVGVSSFGKIVSVDWIKLKNVPATALPVSLISFKAKYRNQSVILDWSTSSEFNNSHYEVLRSDNGSSFSKIGTVNADANSNSVKSYKFVDWTPINGINYYQLRQIDYDGKITGFGPIAVRSDLMVDQFKIFVKGENLLCLNTAFSEAGTFDLIVTDVSGKIIQRFQRNKLSNGPANFDFELPVMQNGVYVVTYRSVSHTFSTKILLP